MAEQKQYIKQPRYNKEGMTDAHMHFVRVLIAFGDKEDWKTAMDKLTLHTNNIAYPPKNRSYIKSTATKLRKKKKDGNLIPPTCDSELIASTFKIESNPAIAPIIAKLRARAEQHFDLPTDQRPTCLPPPARNRNTWQQSSNMTTKSKSGSSDRSAADFSLDNQHAIPSNTGSDEIDDAANALATMTIGGQQNTAKFKPSHLTMFQGVNHLNLKFTKGGFHELEDGSGESVPYVFAEYHPKSVKDLDHTMLRLQYMPGHSTSEGTSYFSMTAPAVSYADVVDNKKKMGVIGASEYKEIDSRVGKTTPENKAMKNGVKKRVGHLNSVTIDELTKGLGDSGDVNKPMLMTVDIAGPKDDKGKRIKFHNGKLQGASSKDPTFLKMLPGKVDFDEEAAACGLKCSGTRPFVYWKIPYIGRHMNQFDLSPKKDR